MSCADVRLDEYLDGELDAGDRAAVESHLAACAGCRTELDRSRKLESVLRSVPAPAAMPDADQFVRSVRTQSRRGFPVQWAMAAAALVALTVSLFLTLRGGPVDVRAEILSYASKPSAAVEDRIRSTGAKGLAELERSLDDADVRVQFASAALLFKLADVPTRERVLACFQQKKESGSGWTLSETGTDDSDVEIVPIAVSLASEGQQKWAISTLKKLHRLNLNAQRKIVDSVVTLLCSTNVEIQRHALEIVKQLEIEFPLSAVVDLIDSPELGEEALRFLRQETKSDFGKDKSAWRKAIGQK